MPASAAARALACLAAGFLCLGGFTQSLLAQSEFEDKRIERIDIAFVGADRDISSFEQFRLVAGNELGKTYSAVRVRSALEALFRTDRIVSAVVEAEASGPDDVIVRFVIKRKSRARRVSVNLAAPDSTAVTEAELLLRLNLLAPGSTVSDRILEENANAILTYLRDRGYFEAEVDYSQESIDSDTDVNVTFDVSPGAQARVGRFDIEIEMLDAQALRPDFELQEGSSFTRTRLNADVDRIRQALREKGYLAPSLEEPRVVYNSEENTIDIEVAGQPGAIVNVTIESENEQIGDKKRVELLPVLREGTLDYSAIVEGERRLETYFQEKGYFFARVTPICSATPQFTDDEASFTGNETEELCTALTGAALGGRTIDVRYEVDLNRRLRLVEIGLEGTDLFSIEDIRTLLDSQEASIIGIVPFLGYGRGYTSLDLLQKDRLTILSILRELGYREARVGFTQGVSPAGEDLIITFIVREGIPTKVTAVDIEGNSRFSEAELLAKLPSYVGENFSRARARNGVRKLSQFYADEGYFDAQISYSFVELADRGDAEFDEVRLVFKVENEKKPVVVNRVLVTGNESTKRDAILKFIDLKPGALLRQTDIFSSEQNLYSTDAFDNVEIRTEPAGETPDGSARQSDIVMSIDEKPPRLITYGGGYSTDVGLSGFFDIRHFNLFGRLYQGGSLVRVSQRQQLVQFDFINPRFIPDGRDENGRKLFSPLTFSAQYQRDSTVTRFFRSTFDQGTFGIVQRIDENGNPIDEFGNSTGDPTINRFTLSAETSRTISRRDRSILFVRYRYEDVRLFNFESLLIRDLLRPDARIRISGVTATFVRDTRRDCGLRYSLIELITKGERGEPCVYDSGDPTSGDYLTAEYKFSAPALGANVGFHRLQLSYNRYFTVKFLNNTTFAGRAVLGVADVFAGGDRFTDTEFEGLNGSLPISERFFGGGSTTLRGFDFETAGPRVVVVPEGIFRNQQGEEVTLNPFTIPFGGNALAIVNLEARVPISESLRVVPFYDGGNIFRKPSEIFDPANDQPGDPFLSNLRAVWTHTVGLGMRIRTPIGGEFAIDYGYLLNPPKFIIPSQTPPDGIYRLYQGQFHFRFSQAF